jgi:hypothetical protein
MAESPKPTAAPQPEAYVIDEDGSAKRLVGDEQIKLARTLGQQFVSKDAAQSISQEFQTNQHVEEEYGPFARGVIGAASGATLGLSDVALSESGAIPGYELSAMRGTTAGQVGNAIGTLAPALFGDEAGLLGKTPMGALGRLGGQAERFAAGVLPEATGALGRMGHRAVSLASRGAFEGSMMAMADEATDAILTNKELSGQSLAATGVKGALFGGILGGGLGLAAGAGGEVGRALRGGSTSANSVSRAMGGKAGEMTTKEAVGLRGLGGTPEDVKRILGEGRSITDALKQYTEIVEGKGGRLTDIGKPDRVARLARETAEESAAARLDAAKRFDKIDGLSAPSVDRMAARLKNEVVNPYAGTVAQREVQGVVNRTIRDLRVSMEPKGVTPRSTMVNWVKSRDQIASSIEDHLNKQFDPSIGREFKKSIKADILNTIDSEIRTAMEGSLAPGAKEIAGAYAGASAMQKAARELETMAGRKLEQAVASSDNLFSARDVGAGAAIAMAGHPLAGAGYMSARALGRTGQRYLEPFLTEWAVKSSVGSKIATATRSTQQLTQSSVRKFFRDKSPVSIATRAGKVAKTSATGTGSSVKSRKDYELSREETEALLSPIHRERVKAHVAQLEATGHTDIAASVLQTYDRAAAYLRHNLPPDMSKTGLGKPMESLWLNQKEQQFVSLREAIEEPLQTVSKIATGDVSREQMLAIKYVYPDIYDEVVESVAFEVAAMKTEGRWLEPDKIVRLGTVLDAPIDETLESSYIGAVQASFAPPPEPQGDSAPPPTTMGPDVQDMLTVAQKGMAV